MGRWIIWLLAGLIVLTFSHPAFPDHTGLQDPEFAKVPFAEWFSGGAEAKLKWSQHILPITLSPHQRLVVPVQIQVNGSEIVKRRGEGKIIFYFQFTDVEGRTYQQHGSFDLAKVEKSLSASDVICTDNAFVLPGDYTVSFAVYDTASGEHASKRETLHVPPLNSDPLPELWRSLPPVDYVDADDPPDCWFLPKVRGEVSLPLSTHRPVRIEVVANLASSQLNTSSYRVKDSDVSVILPYLRVLSQLKGPNVKTSFSLLNVKRRRVVFQQRDVDQLDWQKLRQSLMSVNSGLIDRASLAGSQDIAGFFVGEVARRLASDETSGSQVVIVLTGAMAFDDKQNRPEVRIKSSPGDRLIYIRLRTAPRFQTLFTPVTNRQGNSDGTSGQPVRPLQGPVIAGADRDELANMFAVPGLRLFDVRSADAFRKALAAIVSEISNL